MFGATGVGRNHRSQASMVGARGIEPLTPSMSRKCSTAELSARPVRPREEASRPRVGRRIDNRFAARNGVFQETKQGGGAMVAKMTLRPAADADLAAVMAIERTPGFERFVGRSTLDEHRAL